MGKKLRFRLRILAAGFLAVGVVATGLACGPFYRASLLGADAADNLKFIPGTSFAFEAMHFVERPIPELKSSDNYAEAEPNYYRSAWYQAALKSARFSWRSAALRPAWLVHLREVAEAEGLTPQQIVAVGRMRQADTGDAAYALGFSVPAAVRLYVAGAVDFNHANFEAAIPRFKAVLDLTPDEARPRAVWAAFMLGRSEAKLGHVAEAASAFQTARDWAGRGAPDSQGLAVASYGEEARLRIRRALALVPDNRASMDPETHRLYAEEIGKSMRLYADQASYGSEYGVSSLGFVASHVLESADRIGAVLDDPFVARVLIAHEDARGPFENYPGFLDLSDEDRNPQIVGNALAIAIKAHGVDGLPDLDRLAAVLYEDGQFEDAFALADKLDTPLAYWLRAKQSVRQGDLAAAAENYRRAIAAFPTVQDDRALTDLRRRRLVAESGTVAVGRAEFLQALELFIASGYLDEAVYLAERILSTEELQGFLAGTTGQPPALDQRVRVELSDLLARRLMRAQRFDEAIPLFGSIDTAAKARAYVTALRAGASRETNLERAQALFAAAILARKYGMEILGTEIWPDNAGSGTTGPNVSGAVMLNDAGLGWTAPNWRVAVTPTLFTTQKELDRYRRNAPVPDYKYHYRYIAADEAEQAASLLPPRSQAFAAVLCRATGWMLGTVNMAGGDPAVPKASALYARYLREGAIVPFATHFGGNCPDPDFVAAARFDSEQWNRTLRRLLHRRLTYAAIAGALALIAGATFLFVRRRHVRTAIS